MGWAGKAARTVQVRNICRISIGKPCKEDLNVHAKIISKWIL